MNQNEVSTKTVQLPKNQKTAKKAAFTAETPLQKQTKAAIANYAYMAGRYVTFTDVHDIKDNFHLSFTGLLTGIVTKHMAAYYQVIDQDRRICYIAATQTPEIIKQEDLSANFSVLDYLKWHDTKFLVELCEKENEKLQVTVLKPVMVNFHRQGTKKESAPANSNQKKNASKKR